MSERSSDWKSPLVSLAVILAVVSLSFWVYALFDTVGSDAASVRLLPKPVWVLVVLLVPKVGALLWFLLGRPRRQAVMATGPVGPLPPFPEYDHPHRARAASPEEDEEFLRRCRERAEEQRRRAREAQERHAPRDGGEAEERDGGDEEEPSGPTR